MTDRAQLERLSNPFFDWNEWRRIHKPSLDFMGAELFNIKSQQRDLSEGDFRSSSIDQTDFQLCDISLSDFSHGRITKSFLDNARAHRTVMKKTLIIQTSMEGIDCQKCDFENSSFQEITTKNAQLSQCNLRFLTITNSTFERVIFSDCNIRKLSCFGSQFISCNMRDASMKRIEFNNVNFSGSDFLNTAIVNATIINCNFTDANVSNMDFSGTRLENVDFSKSYGFTKEILANAIIVGNVTVPQDPDLRPASQFTLSHQDAINPTQDEHENDTNIFEVEKNIKERAYNNITYLRCLATDCLYYLKVTLRHGFNDSLTKTALNDVCYYLEFISMATNQELKEEAPQDNQESIFEEISDVNSVQEVKASLLEKTEYFLNKIDREVSHNGRSDLLVTPGFAIVLLLLCELSALVGEPALFRKYYHIMGVIRA